LLPWIGAWTPTLSHFASLIEQFPFFRFLLNSYVYLIGEILPMLFVSSLAGYVLGRWSFPGRDFIFAAILATFIVPSEVTLIPSYLVVKALLGLNNYQSLIVPVWTSAFTIFLMRQAFQGLPQELEADAIVDGAGEFRIFWQIMLPLTRPTLSFAATTAFAATWGDYLRPLIYLTSEEFYPITLGILMLNSAFYGSFNIIAAGMVLATLPIGIVFFLAQNNLCAVCLKARSRDKRLLVPRQFGVRNVGWAAPHCVNGLWPDNMGGHAGVVSYFTVTPES
jgi:ABC-type glycerol-3-phosphate transport system permease component